MAHTDDERGVGVRAHDNIFAAEVTRGVVSHHVYAVSFDARFFKLLHADVAVVSRRNG